MTAGQVDTPLLGRQDKSQGETSAFHRALLHWCVAMPPSEASFPFYPSSLFCPTAPWDPFPNQ